MKSREGRKICNERQNIRLIIRHRHDGRQNLSVWSWRWNKADRCGDGRLFADRLSGRRRRAGSRRVVERDMQHHEETHEFNEREHFGDSRYILLLPDAGSRARRQGRPARAQGDELHGSARKEADKRTHGLRSADRGSLYSEASQVSADNRCRVRERQGSRIQI